MIKEQKYKAVLNIADYFPERIKRIIKGMKQNVLNDICEIRLRVGRPMSLTIKGENVFLSEKGDICYLFQHGLLAVDEIEMNDIFVNMCDRSVYAYEEQIKRGFITLKNGCRVGIAASAVYENGQLVSFSNLSSLNIRIAAEFIDCALPICEYLEEGLLIAGPPLSGKTTVLRDAVRLIANGYGTLRRRVAVVDTRGEIAAVSAGNPTVDLGALCDVISMTDKSKAIESALRTLAPEVIAFDEIGNIIEAKAVIEGINAGVMPICTVHIGSPNELKVREVSKMLISSGAIKNIVFLKSLNAKPVVYSVDKDFQINEKIAEGKELQFA